MALALWRPGCTPAAQSESMSISLLILSPFFVDILIYLFLLVSREGKISLSQEPPAASQRPGGFFMSVIPYWCIIPILV